MARPDLSYAAAIVGAAESRGKGSEGHFVTTSH